MRVLVCGSISEEQKFDDKIHWELEEEIVQKPPIKLDTISSDSDPLSMEDI